MSLIGYVPNISSLSADSFKVIGSGRDAKRLLMLSAPHSVHCDLKSGSVSGGAMIDYVLQADKAVGLLSDSLKTKRGLSRIGYQSSDELRNLAENLRNRQSFSLAALGDSEFDARALAYVCGAAAAASATGCDFDITQNGVANVKLITPTWTVPSLTELTVAPGVARTGPEFATLARFCAMAGAKTITLMSDMAPPSTNVALAGSDCGAFALKLFSTIVSASQSCACAAHHVLAFYKGMNHVITLWGHSDEAGWIRKPLKSALYPISCGVISPLGASYFNIPTGQLLGPHYVTQVVIGLFLEFTGTLVTSDKGEYGKVTILPKEMPGEHADCFPTLRSDFYDLLRTFRARVAKDYDLHPSTVGDEESSELYFRSPPDDAHLKGDVIVPFYWVEPGPLQTERRDYPQVMCQGSVVELELARDCEVTQSPGYVETRGRAAMGCTVFIKHRTPHPRMDGYQYLMSPRYRREDGLSLCELVVEPRAGVFTSDALFVPSGETCADKRRWVTPHNPCPNPAEGLSDASHLTKYTYRGRRYEPTADEWATATVGSMTGSLVVRPFAEDGLQKRQITHVSTRLKSWVTNFSRSRPATMAEMAQFPLDYSSQVPSDTIASQPISETTFAPVEPVRVLVPEEQPPGPDTTTRISRDTGERVRLQDAEVEPEEQEGGPHSEPSS